MRDPHPYLDFAPGVLALKAGHDSSDEDDDTADDDGGNDARDRASHRPLHLSMARPELTQNSSIRSGSVFTDSLSREQSRLDVRYNGDYLSDQDSSAPSMAISTNSNSSTRSASRRRKLHPWELGSGTMESLLDDKPKDKNATTNNNNSTKTNTTTQKKKWGSATESAVTKPSIVAASSSTHQTSTHTDSQKLKFFPHSTHVRSFSGGPVRTEKERSELSTRSTQSRTQYPSTEMRRQSSSRDHVSGGFSFINTELGNNRNQSRHESSTATVPITASNVFSSIMGYAIDPIPEKSLYGEARAESFDSMPVKPPTLKALFRLQEEEVEEDFESAKVKQGIELSRHTQNTKRKTSYEVDAPRLTNTAVQPEVVIRGLDSGNWQKAKVGQELDEISDSDSDAPQSIHSLDDSLHPHLVEGHTDHHAYPVLDDSIMSLQASANELDSDQDMLDTSREIREEAEDQLENLDHAAAVINTFNDILEQAEREQRLLDYAMQERMPTLEPMGSLMEDDANSLSRYDNQALTLFIVEMMRSVDESLQPAKAKLTDLFKWSEKQNVDVVERSKHRENVVKAEVTSKRISRSDALFVLTMKNTVDDDATAPEKDIELPMKPVAGPSPNLDTINVNASTSMVKQENYSPVKKDPSNVSELEPRQEDIASDYQNTNEGNSQHSIGKGIEGEDGKGTAERNASLKTGNDEQFVPIVANLKMPSPTTTLHVLNEGGTGKASDAKGMLIQNDGEGTGQIYMENTLTTSTDSQTAEDKTTKQVEKRLASSTQAQQVDDAADRKCSQLTDTLVRDEITHAYGNSSREMKVSKTDVEVPVPLGQGAILLDTAGNNIHVGERPIAQKERNTKHRNYRERSTIASHALSPMVKSNGENEKVSPRTSSKSATRAGAAIVSREQSRSHDLKLSSKLTTSVDRDIAKGFDRELLSNTAARDSYDVRLQDNVVSNSLDVNATFSSLPSSRTKGLVEPTLIDQKQGPLVNKLSFDSDKNRQKHPSKDTNYEKSVSTASSSFRSRSSGSRGVGLDNPGKPMIASATKERVRGNDTLTTTMSQSDTVLQEVAKPALVNELKKSSSLRRAENNNRETTRVLALPGEETDPLESLSITPDEILAALRGRADIINEEAEPVLGSPVQDSDPFQSLSISPEEVLAALRGGGATRHVREVPTRINEAKQLASSPSKSRSPVRPLKGERGNRAQGDSRDVSQSRMKSQGVQFDYPASAEGDKSKLTTSHTRKARPPSESDSRTKRSASPKKEASEATRLASCAGAPVSKAVAPTRNCRNNGPESVTSLGASSNSSSVRPPSNNRKSDGSTSRRSRSSIESNTRRVRRTDLSRGSYFTSSDDDSINVTKPTFRKAPSRRPQYEVSNDSASSGRSDNLVTLTTNARRSTGKSSTLSHKRIPSFTEQESAEKIIDVEMSVARGVNREQSSLRPRASRIAREEPAAIDANPMMAQSTTNVRTVVEGRVPSSNATMVLFENKSSGGKQSITQKGHCSQPPNVGPTRTDDNMLSRIEKKPRATRNGPGDPKARRKSNVVPV